MRSYESIYNRKLFISLLKMFFAPKYFYAKTNTFTFLRKNIIWKWLASENILRSFVKPFHIKRVKWVVAENVLSQLKTYLRFIEKCFHWNILHWKNFYVSWGSTFLSRNFFSWHKTLLINWSWKYKYELLGCMNLTFLQGLFLLHSRQRGNPSPYCGPLHAVCSLGIHLISYRLKIVYAPWPIAADNVQFSLSYLITPMLP